MQIEPARIARWRERAEEYRVCADACVSPGAQLAYRALAECADRVADRFEHGDLGERDAPAADPSRRHPARARKAATRPV
jgi:hypothetical protein